MPIQKPFKYNTNTGLFEAWTPGDWAPFMTPLRFSISSGEGSTTPLTTGLKSTTSFICPFSGEIVSWALLSKEAATLEVDIIRGEAEIGSTSLVGPGTKPSLTAAKFNSATVTFNTPFFVDDDVLTLEITANDLSTFAQLLLYYIPN